MLSLSPSRFSVFRLIVAFFLFLLSFGVSLSASAQDLKVTKTAPANATAGDSLTYSLSVENIGTASSSGITLSDALPAGTTFQSLTQTSGPSFSVSKPAVGQRGTVSFSRSILQGGTRNSFAGRTVFSFTQVGNIMFFVVGDANIGKELWKTDGTATGTVKIKNFSNIPPSLNYPPFFPSIAAVNNTLYFAADDGVHGLELWKSDGTPNGTVLVKDINPGATDSKLNYFFNVNGTLLFFADDGVAGRELWKSNGTANGTVLVKDIAVGSDGSAGYSPAVFNGMLYFGANDGFNFDGEGGHGYELWRSDGTANGTILLKDINQFAVGGSSPRWMTVVGSTLFFSASDSEHGNRLWKTNGTTNGTVIVAPNQSGLSGQSPNFLYNVSGTLFFFTDGSSDNLRELWKSNGTATGTVRVKIFDSLIENSLPGFPASLGNKLLFLVPDSATGQEYWVSDGTTSGTRLLKDIYPGVKGTSTNVPVEFNGAAFFNANDATSGQELWKTDGTSSGTVRVKDINPGAGNGAGALNVFNGKLLFPGDDGSGTELWVSDGSTSGTVPLRSPGEIATFTVTVKIDDSFSGALSNTASASATGGDANPNNNSATAITQVKALTPPNRAPVLNDISFTTVQDNALSKQLFGTDADGDTLTYARVSDPANGNLTFNANGSFTYAPSASFVGVDSFKATVSDGKATSPSATVTITVTQENRAPVLNNVSYTTVQGMALAGQISGTDADGDTLSYKQMSGPTNGTLSFNANGTFSYSPADSFVGTDSFIVSASDGIATSPPATVTITVTQGNRAPVASDAKFETAQGTALSGQLTGTDADGDSLTFTTISKPNNGELTLNGDGSFTYSPNTSFFGSDSFTFTVSDGKVVSASATATIAVVRSNSNPVLGSASFDATANVAFSTQLVGTDVDGDALTYKVTAGTLPAGLSLSASGLLAGTPTQSGSSVITVEVSDGKGGIGTAQITIVVKAAVVPPTLAPTLTPASPKTNDTLTVAPNGDASSYAYVWKKNGNVIPGESAATLNLAKPGNGDKNDVIACEVTATSASGGAATASAQVTVVNSAPIAISSQGTVDVATEKGFVLNGFDGDGDALTFKRVGGPRNGVTADIRVDPADGKLKLFYKSRPFYGGVDIIRFVAFDSDNRQSNESTLGIRVLYTPPPPANRAPIAGDTNIDTYVGKSEVKGLLGSDPDGDAITFRIVGNAKYGRSEIRRDSDGQFKLFYTSLNRFYGNDSVTYIVTDSRGKESNLATVRINFINRAPIAQGNRIGVASGALVSQYLFGTDEDGDALTFRLVNNPRYGKGEVKLDPEGKWRFYYTSLPGYVGPDQITFIAIDPMGRESSVAAIDINVVRVSSSPSALQNGAVPSGGNS